MSLAPGVRLVAGGSVPSASGIRVHPASRIAIITQQQQGSARVKEEKELASFVASRAFRKYSVLFVNVLYRK
ncbi:hypothetical protein PUN28_019052 [Cardiocondyla obscurior]|uniref:Uncharacterized protein n=1 Tax=Cardiocondyla obscurior TaxID=286306 RepID=A0AAW2EJ31_9HYME